MKVTSLYLILLFLLVACSGAPRADKTIDREPEIFPDYAGVAIPVNIAPLNFMLTSSHQEAYACFSGAGELFGVKTLTGSFTIPTSKWKKLLQASVGKTIEVTVLVKEKNEWIGYQPFRIEVAPDPVDSYLAYRLIEPGYELWNQMGIYQRNLENYAQTPIIENKMTGKNCMNCHSFCMQNPEKMLFHMRATYPGTMLVDGNKIEKLNTKTDRTLSSLVYPSWHPSGKYVAFSVNSTKQAFHLNHKNRIEVFDEASDVVVYDTERHEIVTSSLLTSENMFETFPTFSPDGKTLFFCTAAAHPMPAAYEKVKYSLCSIAFDPATRQFGSTVDTLYRADQGGKSVSFPRVSPDGRYLLYTLSGFGNFSIWHKDADLHRVDLATGENIPMDEWNSADVESYHSWSSNSRWVVFSSRRMDGLYTRPYLAYLSAGGKAGKPFLLPQKDPRFYDRLMKSYNIPEFITGKVKVRARELALEAKDSKGIDVRFAE